MRMVPLATVLTWCLSQQTAFAQGAKLDSGAASPKADVDRKALTLPLAEVGARLQVALIETQLGLDLGYRPSKHIGLGLMFGYGSFRKFNSHCSDQCRDAEWGWFSPYLEGRLNPTGTVSPYGRVAAGIASGAFTHWRSDPSDTVLRGHAELGLDFHFTPKGISFRLFVGESVGSLNEMQFGSVFGLPGLGAQLGTSF